MCGRADSTTPAGLRLGPHPRAFRRSVRLGRAGLWLESRFRQQHVHTAASAHVEYIGGLVQIDDNGRVAELFMPHIVGSTTG